MPDNFKSFGDIFKKEPGLSRLRKVVNDSDVIIKFYEIFPEFEKVAIPVKVEKGVLFLRTENPAWRSELKFNEVKIINKINSFFNDERISSLRFTS